MLFAAAGLVVAPLASLAIIAFRGEPALSLAACRERAPGSAPRDRPAPRRRRVLTGTLGVGTAWLVTVHRFPGRAARLAPAAAARGADLHHRLRLCRSVRRRRSGAGGVAAGDGLALAAEYWFPEIRSLPGCILVMSVVLYPYVYAAARTMFATQSASMVEVARTLGAGRFEMFRTVALPLARPALAIGLALALLEALNDIGASEYLGVRTLTRLGLHHLAQPRQPRRRGADRLPDAGDRRRAHRARAARTPRPALHRLDQAFAHGRADARCRRGAGLVAALACALPVVAGFVLPAGFLSGDRSGAGSSASSTPPSWGISRGRSGSRSRRRSGARSRSRGDDGVALSRSAAHRGADLRGRARLRCPGTVLALGLLAPLIAVDNVLNRLWRLVAASRSGCF